ncbi:hypothetical protein EV193_109156 [Herbihabitans rhizosphaerae]|uniref:Uncharacterized protein n=1 Tax=Herbihabitans rhizosphaerae TaxID=1872711 RepID=A0A4Q7KGW6_9PSEU|nr:hypothetical protein [Herbihabitans rhizosphaerae]RZS34369.1 hypothetical protein EV193_109156 [Herbihabitans rhizosphaerae]
MDEDARHTERAFRSDPYDLEADLARQAEAFKNAPTMAEILKDMDKLRRPDGPTAEETDGEPPMADLLIVRIQRELREGD